MNKNVVANVSHNEYKFFLLNKKCLRHSMNRIQTKNHTLSFIDIEIYIIDNEIDVYKLLVLRGIYYNLMNICQNL